MATTPTMTTSAQRVDRWTTCDVETVRRLDWRFLLPGAELGRVAYLGPDTGTFLPALRRFADSLTVFTRSSHALIRPARAYDLVILRWPGGPSAAAACQLVNRSGALYWEIDRPACLKSAEDVARAPFQDPCRVLRSLGFRQVVAHWHHPDFERCRRMIPIERSAIAYALRHFKQRHALAAMAHQPLIPALMVRFMPHVSALAFASATW